MLYYVAFRSVTRFVNTLLSYVREGAGSLQYENAGRNALRLFMGYSFLSVGVYAYLFTGLVVTLEFYDAVDFRKSDRSHVVMWGKEVA